MQNVLYKDKSSSLIILYIFLCCLLYLSFVANASKNKNKVYSEKFSDKIKISLFFKQAWALENLICEGIDFFQKCYNKGIILWPCFTTVLKCFKVQTNKKYETLGNLFLNHGIISNFNAVCHYLK